MEFETTTYSETQQKILKSALTLIAENGFKATTTREIAKQANVNESTLFKNFHSKAHIFEVIQEHERHTLKQELGQVFTSELIDIASFINYSIQHTYQLFCKHNDYITITLRELDVETLNVGKDSIFEYITNALAIKLSEISGIDSIKYNAAVFMLISSLMMLVVNQANQFVLTDDLQAPVHIEEICELAHQMIGTIH